MRRRALRGVLLLALLAPRAGAGEPPTPEAVAAEILRAHRARDDEGLARAAREADVDPFLVAEALLSTARAEEDGAGIAGLYAEAVRERPDAGGILAMVESERRAAPEDRREASRLRAALAETDALRRAGRSREARDAAERAIRAAGSGAAVPRARLRLRAAEIAASLGDAAAAADHAATAADAATALRWPRMQALAWTAQGRALASLQAYRAAIAVEDRLLAVLEALGWRDERPAVLFRRAQALHASGRLEEALATAEQARAECEALGSTTGAAIAEQIAGLAVAALGRTQEALDRLERAALLFEKGGQPRGRAAMGVKAAGVLRQAGETARALTRLETALADIHRLGAADLVPQGLEEMGSLLVAMGRVDEGLARYGEALDRARARGRPIDTAVWLARIGRTLLQERRAEEALAAFLEAEGIYRQAGDERRLASVRVQVARALVATGRAAQALDRLGEAGDREDASRPIEERWEAAQTRARALESLGRGAEARALLASVLASRERGGADVEPALHRDLARLALDAGDAPQALAHAERALDLRSARYRGLGEEEAVVLRPLAKADADLAVRAALAWQASRPEASSAAAERAFRAMERSRAAWLATHLAHPTGPALPGVPADMRRAEAEALARVRSARRALLSAAFGPTPDPAGVEAGQRDLQEGERALSDARARISRTARRLSDVVDPEPVKPATLAALLGERGAYLAWSWGDERLAAVVVDRQRTTLHDLGAVGDLHRQVEAWLRVVASEGGEDQALAARLHARLLQPLAERLAATDRLVISPEAVLAFLPFEALLEPGPAGQRRVVERLEISYAPSGTVLALLAEDARASPPGTRVLAIGDPVYPGESGESGASAPSRGGLAALERLVGSGEEAREIAALYGPEASVLLLREEATVDRVLAALPGDGTRWRAVHFACHAFVDPEHPLSSGLVLAGGETLGPAVLFRQQIPADLAVLAACETGRGVLAYGEGVIGLARSFFTAGTPRVVVSEWAVSDGESRRFLRGLHAAVHGAKVPLATALREAKVARLKAGGPSSHPRHWAAWVLWGLPDW